MWSVLVVKVGGGEIENGSKTLFQEGIRVGNLVLRIYFPGILPLKLLSNRPASVASMGFGWKYMENR